jgi:hypothetical protein
MKTTQLWNPSRGSVTRKDDPWWRRLTEKRAGGAKSVFQFDVQGSVAKSTHAGIADRFAIEKPHEPPH